MAAHLRNARKGASFQCKTCNKCYSSKQYLNIHQKGHEGFSHSQLDEDLLCDKCGKGFRSKAYLKEHLAFAHEGKPFKCDYCAKKFGTKGNLKLHVASVHEGIRFRCDFCEKSFSSRGNAKQHITGAHRTPKKAADASITCLGAQGAVSPQVTPKTENQEFLYECVICDNIYMETTRLENHIRSEHQVALNQNWEDGCDKSDKISADCDRPVTCMLCKEKIGRKDMKSHIILRHASRKVAKSQLEITLD